MTQDTVGQLNTDPKEIPVQMPAMNFQPYVFDQYKLYILIRFILLCDLIYHFINYPGRPL